MPRKAFKGNTESLNILNNKVNYIGFELEKVPEFLKKFEPLNYRAPKVYDDTTYKVYKYVNINDIDILITPKDRLDELSERYKFASPLFTYMKPENNEDIEKYAYFLKMINQVNIYDIEKIEKEQLEFQKEIPFDVKFDNNFKWQVFYSDYADKYFMLASTNETDNSPMFYLLKRKIEAHKSRSKKESKIFIPISNEEYSGKILKKSEIEDLENYIWNFTRQWASIYEITDMDGKTILQIVGDAVIYDKMTSKFRIILKDKKQAMTFLKMVKALFILSYDLPTQYQFKTRIGEDGGLEFYYNNDKIEYDYLPEFLKKETIEKIKENEKVLTSAIELKADVKDLQKSAEEKKQEYLSKEREIVTFLECKKTFIGKIKYFFKGKRTKPNDKQEHSVDKDRVKDILSHDKKENTHYNIEELEKNQYTVEDLIKAGKELESNLKDYKNAQMDMNAVKNKIENLDKKIKNATEYLEEIDNHKKSIFEFWKYANKDESKMLKEGEETETENKGNLKRTFDYEEDLESFASRVDTEQRQKITHEGQDAIFASNFVLDGINIVSKTKLVEKDKQKVAKLLQELQGEYKKEAETIEAKDFDIFGNVSQDKTKIRTLNNNKHREAEKDKFKVLNVNLTTGVDEFVDKLKDLRKILTEESEKIELPCAMSLYKASNEKIDSEGFNKFSMNPFETLNNLEKDDSSNETYLYKINVPEGTKLIFYSNITFFENNNQTLPLGMDISQESLINLDLYDLELVQKDEFNINTFKDEFSNIVKKVVVYEYNLKQRK